MFSQLAYVRMNSTLDGGTGYYGNLFLLIAIISLAAGLLCSRAARWARLLPYGLLASFALAFWIGKFNLIANIPGEFLWSTVANVYPKPADFDLQLAVLLLCIALSPVMLLIGAKQAQTLVDYGQGARGYLILAAGGVAGGLLFSLQNQFVPQLIAMLVVWVGLLLGGLWPELTDFHARSRVLFPLVLLLGLGGAKSAIHRWSPYQRVDVRGDMGENSVDVLSNGFFIMSISTLPVDKVPIEQREIQSYVFGSVKPSDRVLVLGTGGGTADTREALHAGAKHVTAVEIDPAFLELGLELDPQRSFEDERVRTVVGDARAFLGRERDEQFDIVYMPFLDSQTNASSQSRFRLDSFLYTRDGLKLAFDRVREGGALFLNFATSTPWIRGRMYHLLSQATGRKVRVFQRENGIQSLYVVAHGDRSLASIQKIYTEATAQFADTTATQVPTDDWPFFYSQHREIPIEHVRMLVVLLVLMIAIFSLSRNLAGPAQPTAPSVVRAGLLPYAMFSGAAFFFIELRTISALTPVLGSTYESQAMVIIVVIVSSLIGSMAASYKGFVVPPWAAWPLLFGALALSFAADALFHPLADSLLGSELLFVVALILPTFVAGYIYVHYLLPLDASSVVTMQKWNYIGGGLGGLSEAAIILVGFRQSLWISVALYVLACACVVLPTLQRRGTRLSDPAAAE